VNSTQVLRLSAPVGSERVLVVEDEPTVRELLMATFRFAGFAVASADTGAQALASARQQPPDLVLLDVMLPDMDGFEVLRRLRERPGPHPTAGPVPVVFLTARDEPGDKINGLMSGGDDYVTKPFDPEELLARVHAVLRRTRGLAHDRVVRVGDLELDAEGHEVRKAGAVVQLSPTEFRLLQYLMDRSGRVLPKRRILTDVWNYDFGGDPSIVDTYISYVRRKVDTGEPKLIHTVHGVGFVLRAPRS
jgi:two-component system OmpR family response regulator